MAARPRGGASSRCPACRAPVLTQLDSHRAALLATVDLTPLTPDEQRAVREPNRLIYCLVSRPHCPPRIRPISPWHPPDCPHPHVTEHRCPPAEPTTLF
ncbi:hypothetical protein [Streptomyces sp. AMCC400023]|uniref:hypothetical protein n=1 Tax=Streptomyces sp. AMCC400023 TaxID=2056258 RepID=UPI001F3ED067|nr:hypothetical protein [Streptomyces sp. AMCC400023]